MVWVSKVFDTQWYRIASASPSAILAKIFVIRSFFVKNGYLLIFFACQKIINSFASKLAQNFYTFDTCIIKWYLKLYKDCSRIIVDWIHTLNKKSLESANSRLFPCYSWLASCHYYFCLAICRWWKWQHLPWQKLKDLLSTLLNTPFLMPV